MALPFLCARASSVRVRGRERHPDVGSLSLAPPLLQAIFKAESFAEYLARRKAGGGGEIGSAN